MTQTVSGVAERWQSQMVKFDKIEFLSQVVENGETGCWDWIGTRWPTGYGTIEVNGRRIYRAHRVSWEMFFGTIPPGMLVLHRCDRRMCVNPYHLFVGTQSDNIRDAIRKGRFKDNLVHVNPLNRKWQQGEKHWCSKLSDNDRRHIYKQYHGNQFSQPELAKQFGVTPQTIGRITRNRMYAVPGSGASHQERG